MVGVQGSKSTGVLRMLSFTQPKVVLKMHFLEPSLCLETIQLLNGVRLPHLILLDTRLHVDKETQIKLNEKMLKSHFQILKKKHCKTSRGD